ncbi:HK97-gp10 family putative phage morphogenesis protein [Bacillus swezeyi]|uniref:HK97 gp10 family phage protein n=1 Tax=Bacillus swezeyi TaxID=1925020 RepID=A0A5M8RJB1_9BACI|nr:HK97-gp10 family putative phage morphogenesis protein [Bacillus swezeyi]KAA6447588.1 hypothetical protein DX927_20145 [Bacillus swezeyi]TYS34169.1 hypothetical protein FZC77_17150 [Bacillus swezeyi]
MRISAQIQGIDEAIAQLKQKGKDLKKVQPKALRAGANILAKAMKAEVNVSNIDHLHIKDDIKVRQTPKKERIYPDAISYDVGPGKETAWRARFHHDGFIAKNGRVVRGNPFGARSYRIKKNAINQAVLKELQRGLR